MRKLVIGDVHGGYKALIQVLEKAKVTYEDTLIFLGDYVDGWSESAQVIEKLLELSKSNECIFIKGNHDLKCKSWLEKGAPFPIWKHEKDNDPFWLLSGGNSTINSYIDSGFFKNKEHLTFFRKLKNYHLDEKNKLYLHAGFTSLLGIGHENELNYCFDRALWEDAVSIAEIRKKGNGNELFHDPLRFKFYKEIFIGHTPTLHFDSTAPMNELNVWNLDTGAAFTGSLSMDVDTKQYWQSDPLPFFYPNERGRN